MMSDINPLITTAMMFNQPYQQIHSNHHKNTTTNVTSNNNHNDSNASSNEEANINKKRTRVTPSQLTVLEETFNITATPDSKMRKHLAAKLQMPERSIQIWFQNRRAKVKMLQKRFLLRQEQEAARARLYASNPHTQHHHHPHPYQYSPYQYANPIATANSPIPYWYNKYPQYAPFLQKMPIHRAWSTDSNHQPFVSSLQHPATLSSSSTATTLSQPFPYEATATTNNNGHGSNASDNSSSLLMTGSNGLSDMTVSPSPTPQPFVSKKMESEPLASSATVLFSSLSMNPSASYPLQLQCQKDGDEEGCITATAVTIGSWHRMKIDQQDLTCSYNNKTRNFSWHIRDNNYHFKMMISFDSVQSIELNVLEDNISAQVDIDVSEPPQFFMEKINPTTTTTATTMNNNENAQGWVQCSDFTEGMQASIVLRHTIRGLATDLRHDLLTIAGVDDRLCQITRFPSTSASIMNMGASASVPPPVNIGLLTNTATNDEASLLAQMDYSNGLLNQQQNYWRHQSLPPSALMTNALPTTNYHNNNNNNNSINFFTTPSSTNSTPSSNSNTANTSLIPL